MNTGLMTVSDMIKALSALPSNLVVVVEGINGSRFDPVIQIEELVVSKQEYDESGGEFEMPDEILGWTGEPFLAVTLIGRRGNLKASRLLQVEEFEAETIELNKRELARRNALSALGDPDKRDQAIVDLLNILHADRERPLDYFPEISIEEVRDLPTFRADDVVLSGDLPEPWATRFRVAMHGEGPGIWAYNAADWDRFLDLWEKDHRDLEQLAQKLDSL